MTDRNDGPMDPAKRPGRAGQDLPGLLTAAIATALAADGVSLPVAANHVHAAVREALAVRPGRRNLLLTADAVQVFPGPPATDLGIASLRHGTYVVALDVLAVRLNEAHS